MKIQQLSISYSDALNSHILSLQKGRHPPWLKIVYHIKHMFVNRFLKYMFDKITNKKNTRKLKLNMPSKTDNSKIFPFIVKLSSPKGGYLKLYNAVAGK